MTELFAVLQATTTYFRKELHYIVNTSTEVTIKSRTELDVAAWVFDQWTEPVVNPDSPAETGGEAWHYSIRSMACIALLLAHLYSGPIIFEESTSTYKRTQSRLSNH
jgi:hypothetical protein